MLSLGTMDMVIGDYPMLLTMQLFTTLPESHSLTLYTLERIKFNLTQNQQLDAPLNENNNNNKIVTLMAQSRQVNASFRLEYI